MTAIYKLLAIDGGDAILMSKRDGKFCEDIYRIVRMLPTRLRNWTKKEVHNHLPKAVLFLEDELDIEGHKVRVEREQNCVGSYLGQPRKGDRYRLKTPSPTPAQRREAMRQFKKRVLG